MARNIGVPHGSAVFRNFQERKDLMLKEACFLERSLINLAYFIFRFRNRKNIDLFREKKLCKVHFTLVDKDAPDEVVKEIVETDNLFILTYKHEQQ